MSGNVNEWCQDIFGTYKNIQQTNPTGVPSGLNRVNRGGGWLNNAGKCRISSRNYGEPSNRNAGLGFRLVLLS